MITFIVSHSVISYQIFRLQFVGNIDRETGEGTRVEYSGDKGSQ